MFSSAFYRPELCARARGASVDTGTPRLSLSLFTSLSLSPSLSASYSFSLSLQLHSIFFSPTLEFLLLTYPPTPFVSLLRLSAYLVPPLPRIRFSPTPPPTVPRRGCLLSAHFASFPHTRHRVPGPLPFTSFCLFYPLLPAPAVINLAGGIPEGYLALIYEPGILRRPQLFLPPPLRA